MTRGVDRDELLDSVRHLLAAPGSSGVLMTGDAGVGKSHLASRVIDLLQREGYPTRRLFGAGFDDVPLGALSRAFSHDEAYAGVAPIVSMKRFLESNDRASVLMIDDVNQLDMPSVATLVEVAEAGLAQLIVTIRTGAAIPYPLERCVTSGSISQFACPPLSPSETSAWASTLIGGPLSTATARTVFDLTQGNALFVRELITAAREEGTIGSTEHGYTLGTTSVVGGRLGDWMARRLSRLEPDERDALRRIAIAGEVGHAEINEFVGDDTLARLEERNLITTALDGRRLHFTTAHPLHGEIIRSTESELVVRQIRIEHAARIQTFGLRRGQDRLRLATWSLEGICIVDSTTLVEAARMAAKGGDDPLSRRLAAAAFAREPTVETAHLLAIRLYTAGDFEALKEHFTRWEPLVQHTTDRAVFETTLTNASYWRGFDERSIDRLTDRHDSWSDNWSFHEAQSTAASLLVTTGRIDDAIALAEALVDVPPGPSAVRVALALGHGLRARGKPLSAAQLVSQSLDFYRSVSPDAHLLSDIAMAGLHIQTLAEAGRFAEVDAIVAARSDSWHDLGDRQNSGLAHLAISFAWFLRGDSDQAVRWAHEARQGFESTRQIGMIRWALTMEALAHAESGDVAPAQRLLHDLDRQRDHPAQIFAAALARARSWVDHHRQRGRSASRLLHSAVDRALEVGNVASAVDCLHDLARQGHVVEAASRLLELDVDGIEGPFHDARIAYIRSASTGDLAELERCMQAFDRFGCARMAADCAVAAAMSSAVSSVEAKRWLGEAAERHHPSGNGLARAVAELPLTAREREVASLAVNGMTSRQIADHLGNSRRTIETHLGNVYTKLGVDGRIGLIERLR